MASSGNKRKRSDRQHDESSGRPSPHRPENMGLAHYEHNSGSSRGGRGGRRQSRQGAQSPVAGASAFPVTPTNAASSAPRLLAQQQRDTPMVESSGPATPVQLPAPVSQQSEGHALEPPPVPYFFEFLTDVRIESWQQHKEEVRKAAEEADDITASVIIQELVRSALDGRLDAAEAGSVVRQMILDHTPSGRSDVQTVLLNTLSLLEESDTKNPSLLGLVAATDINPEMIRQELDIPLLQALSLVRTSFTQMRTRKTTNILYRQANFNLLREETEGYAKLITEYFNTASEAVHNAEISAEDAFQRVMALVGSFDLDVGRVLDITLDISANLLVRAYAFFVKFYRCSSWWPENGVVDNVKWEDQGFSLSPGSALSEYALAQMSDGDRQEQLERLAQMKEARDLNFWARVAEVGMEAFFELGARRIVDFDAVLPLLETEIPPEYDARQKEINADRRKRINENRKYMRETKTLPPQGNPDAAQLLGFKLRFYASEARSAQDTLPENLIYLAALLIKIGFISLRDLYPHLYPADDKMAEEKSRLEKEKKEKEAKDRPGAAINALAMAGALPDDTITVARGLRDKEKSGGTTPRPEKKEEEPKDELPSPTNQKVLLLKALLLIGALPEALYILGRFPWLADVDVSLPPYLHRIARRMLEQIDESIQPINHHDGLRSPKSELSDTSENPLKMIPKESKKPTRWLGLDQVDKGDGQSYRHYYSEWDDNIPVCRTTEDVFLLCNTFLGFLGVKIGQDAELLGTLVRFAKHSLTQDGSDANRARWLELMKRLLVPALSLSKHNLGLSQMVYQLLMLFPTPTRYNVYAEWFQGKTSRLPDMRVIFDHNKAEVKDVLRRVTNDSGKKQARALAKVSSSAPGIVMMSMISQLESYSNMIPSLVECTRYFSLLAYDVLTWCLINSLSGQGRDRMQADGMLTSPWLQALSHFVASLFSRYSCLNPSPVLQYLASELRASNFTDLEMFEQVLAEMAGVRSDMEFNDAQILAMSGGEQLQAITMLQLADKRHARKTQALRLLKSLAEPGLIGQMLIVIAQERQMYPHHESSKDMPLKVLGNNLDKIQQVLVQYLEVLKAWLKPSEFIDAVPDVVGLIGDFGLAPGLAFAICRMGIINRINEFNTLKEQEEEEEKRQKKLEQAQNSGDVEMQDGSMQPSSQVGTKQDISTAQASNNVTANENEQPSSQVGTKQDVSTAQASNNVTADENEQPWHPILLPIIQTLPGVSPRLADRVSIPFFVTFWTFGLQDILVHTTSYKNEISKLTNQINDTNVDRSNATALVLKEHERKRKSFSDIQDKLREELKGRIAVYQKTRNRLSRLEKYHWFGAMRREEAAARHNGLLQECFLPRSMVSSLDAYYSFLMLKILHENGTPGFSTMHFLNQLLKKEKLAAIMFQCTAMEAQHFGRFLCEILKMLQIWHADKATYEKEAIGAKHKLHGFVKKFDANGEPEVIMGFEEFRRLLFNWHSFLCGALQLCFESGEYMHIRNGIIVLKSIVQVFPSLNFMGHNMVKQVTKLSEEEPRQDLKLAARSLLAPLRHREKQWLMPQAFRLNDPLKEAARSHSRAPSTQQESPQPSAGPSKLNAAVAEFKPTTDTVGEVAGRKASIAGIEDGEIDDERHLIVRDVDTEMKDVSATNKGSESSQNKTAEKKGVKESHPQVSNATPAKETQKPGSRPSTPAPVLPKSLMNINGAGQAETSRPQSTQPVPTRPPHAIPSRLEPRPSNHPSPASPADRGGRYPIRRDDGYGRLDRPNDLHPGSREQSPGGLGSSRTTDRDGYNRGPQRDDRNASRIAMDSRASRDDAWASSRRDQATNLTRDRPNGGMGPPSNQTIFSERAGYIPSAVSTPPTQHASRPNSSGMQGAPSAETDNQYRENPARLALINEDHTPSNVSGKDLMGPARDSRRDGDGRDERGIPRPDFRSNGRSGGSEYSREQQPRPEQPNDLAPTGPRPQRLGRDFGPSAPLESSYGRLNGPQDVLSGPRPPNGPSTRSGHNFNAPLPQGNFRSNESPMPPQQVSHTQEYSASFRGPNVRQQLDRRNSGHQFDRQPFPGSMPPTIGSENGPALHTNRAGQFGAQPPPIQTNMPLNTSRSMNSPTSGPPSGPRGPVRAPLPIPMGPSPTNNGPPSGPVSAMERQRRQDRQRANINATLQGAVNNVAGPNGQGVSFRGAAQNRQSSFSQVSAVHLPPVQVIASPIEPPPRRNEPSSRQESTLGRPEFRPDLFQNRPDRDDDIGGTGGARNTKQQEDSAERHRSGGNTGHERTADGETSRHQLPSVVEDGRNKLGGQPDERRTNERDVGDGPPRDWREANSRPRNEDMTARRPRLDMPSSFMAPPPEWKRPDGRGPRRDGPDDGRPSGRGGGGRNEDVRGGGREGERRDGTRVTSRESVPSYAGNKRRHEDGSFDDPKRRRSER